MIHRDLKPSNVMITTNGNVKLLDFGLAKLTGAAATTSANTRTMADLTGEGKVVGTVSYMSPEQAQGHPLDARSDIFSFGSMLFEILTGQQAFKRENTTSTLAAILRDEPRAIGETTAPTLPRDVEKLLRRCLRKASAVSKPRRTYGSPSTICRRTYPAGRRRRHRYSWTVWGASVAASLVLAGGFWWLRSRPSARVVSLRQQTFDAGMALMPALSSDGKLLVYVSDSAGEGVLDLWVKQVAGGSAVRLVSGMGSVSNPHFSPDATSVYYLGPQHEIFEVSTLGGPSRELIDSAGPFAVSARGDIAFVQPPTGGGLAPMLMMSPGGSPSRWRKECSTAVPPAWSPEGKQVAFMGTCNDQLGLFLSSHDGSFLRKIAGDVFVPSSGREGPAAWSQIFWYRMTSGREGLVVSWRHGDTVNLTRLSLDGKTQPITQGTG